MKFLPLWTLIGPAIILTSLVLGYLRKRHNFCRMNSDRYGDMPGEVFSLASAISLAALYLIESGDTVVLFCTGILPAILKNLSYILVTFVTFLVGFAAYGILTKAHSFGYFCGTKNVERAIRKQQSACRANFNCVLNCPRAGRRCPLKGTVFNFEEIPIENKELEALKRSHNPETTGRVYAFFKVTHLRTKQVGYAVETPRKKKRSLTFFTPIPAHQRKTKDFEKRTPQFFNFAEYEETKVADIDTFSVESITAEAKGFEDVVVIDDIDKALDVPEIPIPRDYAGFVQQDPSGKVIRMVGYSGPRGSKVVERGREKINQILASTPSASLEGETSPALEGSYTAIEGEPLLAFTQAVKS